MAHILVIDDEPMVRQMLTETLELAGHTIRAASNGREAALKIKQEHFDLLITDILMPERDGLETIVDLKRENETLPVIAISGMAGDSPLYLKMARLLGAWQTLEKPFTSAELSRLVNNVLAEAKRRNKPRLS